MGPREGSRTVLAGTIFATGFAAAGGQVVLLREAMMVAGGNELIAGLALCCWMVGTAAGSALSGWLLGRRRATSGPADVCAALLVAMAPGLPLSLWTMARVREIAGPEAGEALGLLPAVAVCVAACVPLGLIVGATFPAFCRLFREGRGPSLDGARAAAMVLAIEGLGFAAAGALYGMVLVGHVSPGTALVSLGVLVCLATMGLGRRGLWSAPAAVLLVGAVAITPRGWAPTSLFDEGVVERSESRHGRIEVLAGEGQHDVVLNGVWAFSIPDLEAAERTVHPVLLHHPEPERVLLVGGAVTGALDEILKHPSVRHVDVVEFDPALVETARVHLPGPATRALDDPRVTMHYADARAHVARSEDRHDVVLVAMPDPDSAQLNRYYTVEWFELLRERIAPGGLVAVGVTGSATMLGPAQASYVASVRRSLAEVFPVVQAVPGDRTLLLGSEDAGALAAGSGELAARLVERGITTRYVEPFGLEFELGPLRMDYLEQVLAEAEDTRVNRDLMPLCFFQDTVLWATAQSPRWRETMTRLGALRPSWLSMAILAGALLHAASAAVSRRNRCPTRAAVPAAVAVVGGTGIVGELAVILAYQAAFGHLYHRIGVIVAAYMVGLAAGAWWMSRRSDAARCGSLVAIQLAMAVACGVLWLGSAQVGLAALPPLLEPLFPGIVAVLGGIAGLHFPAAVGWHGGGGAAPGRPRSVGGLYAADLAGASAAALIASSLAIPLLGVPAVLGIAAVANVGAAIVLVSIQRLHRND